MRLSDPEYADAVARALDAGEPSLGRETALLEADLAHRVGVPHAIAVSSGTSALTAMLLAVGVEPGDEVIVPATTFSATALAVLAVGATPVFADVDRFGVLDPEAAFEATSDRTSAILGVDLDGHPADFARLSPLAGRQGLAILEDACPALGATLRDRHAGDLAEAAAVSFNSSKRVPAFEGGAVLTRKTEIAERVRRLRNFGEFYADGERVSREFGTNWKMPEIVAAIARVGLDRLDDTLARGRAFDATLRNPEAEVLRPPPIADGVEPAWHKYRMRLGDFERKDDVLRAFSRAGVPTMLVPPPLPAHPVFGGDVGEFPMAADLHDRSIVVGSRDETPWTVSGAEMRRWRDVLDEIEEAA